VANVILNRLEVSPRSTHLRVIVGVAGAWIVAQPNDRSFWVDAEICRSVRSTIDSITRLDPGAYVDDYAVRTGIGGLSNSELPRRTFWRSSFEPQS
jgi:hypothetical protein